MVQRLTGGKEKSFTPSRENVKGGVGRIAIPNAGGGGVTQRRYFEVHPVKAPRKKKGGEEKTYPSLRGKEKKGKRRLIIDPSEKTAGKRRKKGDRNIYLQNWCEGGGKKDAPSWCRDRRSWERGEGK